MKNKIIAFLLVILTSINVLGEEVADYEYIFEGHCVKKNGFLFSEEGMGNLYLNIDEKIKLAVLDKQKEASLCKINLENCSKLKESELRIQKEMFEKQLFLKQETINNYKSEIFWNNFKIIGGTAVGIGVGVLFTKLLIK